MAIPLIAEIERWITEHGSSQILRERLSLAKEQLLLLESQVAKLEQENAKLRRQADEAQGQLAAHAAAQEYTEHRGALFKRGPAGGYVATVYCPRCRTSTAPWPPRTGEFACDCGWMADFTPRELPGILGDLVDPDDPKRLR